MPVTISTFMLFHGFSLITLPAVRAATGLGTNRFRQQFQPSPIRLERSRARGEVEASTSRAAFDFAALRSGRTADRHGLYWTQLEPAIRCFLTTSQL